MPNPNYIKNGGSWVNVSGLYCNDGGSWVEADEGHKNVAGTWTKFYDKYSATTVLITVRVAEFDEDTCECTLTSTYKVWHTSSYPHDYAVNKWVSDGNECAKVTAINVAGSFESYVYGGPYNDCSGCNTDMVFCEALDDGYGPGGP